eukprot:14713591-Alexandrium_andersonii.AAC.1
MAIAFHSPMGGVGGEQYVATRAGANMQSGIGVLETLLDSQTWPVVEASLLAWTPHAELRYCLPESVSRLPVSETSPVLQELVLARAFPM